MTKQQQAQRVAAWRAANPERSRQLARESYARNSGKRREAKRRYFQQVVRPTLSTEGGRLRERLKKQRRRAPGGGLTPAQWSALCESYGFRCAYCGEVRPLTMDHVIPVSRGGRHEISNIVPACRSCNSSKGAK